MSISQKKRRISKIAVISVIFMSILILPIKVKRAVDVEFASEETDINTVVGHMTTLLCTPYLDDDIWPEIEKYLIIAVENDQGIFEKIKSGDTKNEVSMLYVYPDNFIGGAIKSYNYGFNNQFIFTGVLSTGSRIGDYNMSLESWDIAYPVYHWEFYLGPDNEFYRRHIFVFDFLIP